MSMSGPLQTSPSSMPPHHQASHMQQGGPSQPNGHGPPPAGQPKGSAAQQLIQLNEAVWLNIGSLAETMGHLDNAMEAYERALSQNPYSVPALNAISCILRTKELFPKAVEYLQLILNLEQNNGEVWGSLGHCYLMMDDLQKAYQAYQQALYHLRDPKEPKLWYGIGILYDRYGSLEHAEEAFTQVMRMDTNFEKANEIYFRLGIIYKQQQKYAQSLECFRFIVQDPPRPLTEEDIWFQIGHVYEQQKDYNAAKDAYKRVLDRDPNHAKVLQQLGWLHHQQNQSFESQAQAIEYLEKSVSADNSDAQSWYLLGRCYMSQQKYPKAYEAYQQAVYRDGRNPTFWCSIGVLYYQINQYRDALDAYSRAIRLNPYISEVWYDLGTLYESCNNQVNDALDAYQRAAELDPSNVHIKARLNLLRNGPSAGTQQHNPPAPLPQDVHPQSYQASGPPGPQWGAQAPQPPQHQQRNQGPPLPATLPQIPPQAGPGPAPSPYRPADNMPQRVNSMRSPEVRATDGIRHPALRRGFSPSPKIHAAHPPPMNYGPPPHVQQGPPPPYSQGPLPSQVPPPQALPPHAQHPQQQHQQQPPQMQLPPQMQQQPPPSHQQQQLPPQQQQQQQQQPGLPPSRILNPQHDQRGPAPPQHPLAPSSNGSNGPGMTLYGHRGGSPIPEVKPIIQDDRMPSPTSNYPLHHGHGQTHLQHPQSGIANGAPPPASALAAAEEAARSRDREREEKQPMGSGGAKRLREWEDDESMSAKKPASNENRARMDDHFHHRASPPRRLSHSPPRRLSAERLPPHDDYRASTQPPPQPAPIHNLASNRPMVNHQQLPSMSDAPPPPPPQSRDERERETPRKEIVEPPARKMEVDEDYDDEPEVSEKRGSQGSAQPAPEQTAEHNSPTAAKALTGPNGTVNGTINGVEK